ncbi:hypothetical protein LO772_29740 [Yinghuangia sp. ASG 101]|uniref:hypothetical protein n=1 Tax=Yinghuangia sp. ASG 101 TaxID=2896848 RepID=UPI001E305075|nr:hypothetical protein [Yinghuangia sp. ASG 101]UGQ10950.1 hypothetical protein LO772_29740 [Yinghuangia sp. ASG 101]
MEATVESPPAETPATSQRESQRPAGTDLVCRLLEVDDPVRVFSSTPKDSPAFEVAVLLYTAMYTLDHHDAEARRHLRSMADDLMDAGKRPVDPLRLSGAFHMNASRLDMLVARSNDVRDNITRLVGAYKRLTAPEPSPNPPVVNLAATRTRGTRSSATSATETAAEAAPTTRPTPRRGR